MNFKEITAEDLFGKGVTGLPDTPGLSTTDMQAKFDELVKEVMVPKFNALVRELAVLSGVKSVTKELENTETSIPTGSAVAKYINENGGNVDFGSSDISGIGDGTVAGAIVELHSKLSSLHTYYYNHGTKQPVYAKYNLITSITVPKGMYLFIAHVKSSKVIDANLNATITPVSGSIDPYGNTNVIGDANNNGGDSCLSLMINVLTDSEIGLYSYGYSDSEYNIIGYLTAIKL